MDAASAQADKVRKDIDALLAQSTKTAQESAARVKAQADQVAELSAKALATAEQSKTDGVREAESQVAAAHRQSAMMKDRLEEQYAWRKEQLERETHALELRKDAVLAQLSNVRALAQESVADFPNTDSLTNAALSLADGTSTGPDATMALKATVGPEGQQSGGHEDDQQWLAHSGDNGATDASPDEETTMLKTKDPQGEPRSSRRNKKSR